MSVLTWRPAVVVQAMIGPWNMYIQYSTRGKSVQWTVQELSSGTVCIWSDDPLRLRTKQRSPIDRSIDRSISVSSSRWEGCEVNWNGVTPYVWFRGPTSIHWRWRDARCGRQSGPKIIPVRSDKSAHTLLVTVTKKTLNESIAVPTRKKVRMSRVLSRTVFYAAPGVQGW